MWLILVTHEIGLTLCSESLYLTGGDSVLEWGEDECVSWYVTDISAARGSAFEIRADVDGAQGGIHEYVWIASYSLGSTQTGTIYEVDSETGEKTGREIADTPGYGLAMGPGGLLWSTGLGLCPRSTDRRPAMSKSCAPRDSSDAIRRRS